MKKDSPRKATSKRQRRGQQPPPLPPSKWWTPFRKAVASAVGLVAFASALLAFLPRVSMDMAPSTDSGNEFAIVATLQNTGYVPLEDVQLWMGLCQLDTTDFSPHEKETFSSCEGSLKARFKRESIWHFDHFAMDQKKTFTVGDLFTIKPPTRIANADLSIIIEYRPAFWPFHYEKEFGIKSKRADDGSLSWFFVPRG